MDLLSNLNTATWQNATPEKIEGLKEYTVIRSKMTQQGKIEFAVRDTNKEDSDLVMGILDGVKSKKNPLQSVRNIEMKIEKGLIVAVNLDGDCVAKK